MLLVLPVFPGWVGLAVTGHCLNRQGHCELKRPSLSAKGEGLWRSTGAVWRSDVRCLARPWEAWPPKVERWLRKFLLLDVLGPSFLA